MHARMWVGVVLGLVLLGCRTTPRVSANKPLYEAGQTVTVVVHGASRPDEGAHILQSLRATVEEMADGHSVRNAEPGRLPRRYEVAPIDDPQQLAGRISFGTVMAVNGRTIEIQYTKPQSSTP